jgi:ferritin-like metal-binding protein YciE
MAKLTTPRDLLIQEIKDLYSAEIQLIKMLPRMAKAATQAELKDAFSRHLEETRRHSLRIEKIMTKLNVSPRGRRCKAMEGMLEKAREVIEGDAPPVIRDLALIAVAQKVEHYEMAGYGCARTLADLIGESELADTLQESLDEEGATDKLLTEVAMGINIEAGEPTAAFL